jgi:hypothetical protein
MAAWRRVRRGRDAGRIGRQAAFLPERVHGMASMAFCHMPVMSDPYNADLFP